MRSRSLFGSGLVVFIIWYWVAFCFTSPPSANLLAGFIAALLVVFGGTLVGVGVGVAGYAIDLALLHRRVRQGDARGGARVTLGRLPEIVPVVRGVALAAAAEPAPTEQPVAPRSEPVPPAQPAADPDGSAAAGDADTDAADMPPELGTVTQDPQVGDRLAVECARFTADHEAVAVAPVADGSCATGSIDRIAEPDVFAEFMALIDALASDGIDVSAVAVAMDADGVPTAVTFPLPDSAVVADEVQK